MAYSMAALTCPLPVVIEQQNLTKHIINPSKTSFVPVTFVFLISYYSWHVSASPVRIQLIPYDERILVHVNAIQAETV